MSLFGTFGHWGGSGGGGDDDDPFKKQEPPEEWDQYEAILEELLGLIKDEEGLPNKPEGVEYSATLHRLRKYYRDNQLREAAGDHLSYNLKQMREYPDNFLGVIPGDEVLVPRDVVQCMTDDGSIPDELRREMDEIENYHSFRKTGRDGQLTHAILLLTAVARQIYGELSPGPSIKGDPAMGKGCHCGRRQYRRYKGKF